MALVGYCALVDRGIALDGLTKTVEPFGRSVVAQLDQMSYS